MELKHLRIRLDTLTIFRSLLQDFVIQALYDYLASPTPARYAAFVSSLYTANGGNLSAYIRTLCLENENVYVKRVGRGEDIPNAMAASLDEELQTLQALTELTPESLRVLLDWEGFLPAFDSQNINLAADFAHRAANIGKYGYGLYAKNRMFYLDDNGSIVPVKHPDPVRLSDFAEYEEERRMILDNTRALLAGRSAVNILLTGDAGTGKSSTIKAIGNELYTEGLRILEVRKDQLRAIPKILDELSGNPLKFVLFIDDLSFLKDDDQFNALKAVLEGSVSSKSKNVVIYATGNRRHLIKESFAEREGDDVHRNDTMQEIVSLSERFGLHIRYQKPDKATYLRIVRHLADQHGLTLSQNELELKAERFALARSGRSARLARQFVENLLAGNSL